MAAQKVAFFFFSHLVVHLLRLRKTAFLSHYISKRTFCQDRLGTNIGKAQKQMMPFFAPLLREEVEGHRLEYFWLQATVSSQCLHQERHVDLVPAQTDSSRS
jgi:hypothetical protein